MQEAKFNCVDTPNSVQESNIIEYFTESSRQGTLDDSDFFIIFDWTYFNDIFFNVYNDILSFWFDISKYFLSFFLPRRQLAKKRQIRGFKFKNLFVYSTKQLKIKKRRMLLVNMKKTLNNFWAWIRTHTIFYIPKVMQKIKDYFYSLRNQVSFFTPKNGIHSRKKKRKSRKELFEDIEKNEKRMKRKAAFFKEQAAFKRKRDPRYKEKAVKIQQGELRTYIEKHKEYYNELRELYITKPRVPFSVKNITTKPKEQKVIQLYVNQLLSIIQKRFLNYINTYQTALNLPEKQNVILQMGENIFKHFKQYPIYVTRKINYHVSRRLQWGIRQIKKQFLPPPQYKKLQQIYKRDRVGLFQELTRILARKQSKRQLKPTTLYTLKCALKLARISWKRYVRRFKRQYKVYQQSRIIQHYDKNYFGTDIYKIFEYNYNELIAVFVNLVIRARTPVNLESSSQILPKIKEYLTTNLAELKRILSNTSFGH